MTITEAYELTLEKIEELKKEGIKITIKPSKSESGTEPNGILREKWITVIFNVENEGHAMKVRATGDYLGMCGIVFDTGGWQGHRDWQLDWSFRYTGKEDEEWRDARDEVEDLIKRGAKN